MNCWKVKKKTYQVRLIKTMEVERKEQRLVHVKSEFNIEKNELSFLSMLSL